MPPSGRAPAPATLAAATLAAVVLNGCSLLPAGADGPSPAASGAGSTGPSTSSTPAQHREFQLDAQGYDPVSADFPARPIAVRPTDTRRVMFELYQVRRTGKVVTVVFALHNTGSKSLKTDKVADGLDEAPNATELNTSRVALVDPVGLKEYQTFLADPKDPYTACLCSRTYEVITPETQTLDAGDRRYYANEIAAPPASVTTVTVQAGIASVPGVRITA